MLEKAIENGDTIINKRLFKIVELMNQERNLGYSELKSVKQLLEELKISRDFYYESYIKYVKGMIDGFSIYDINIPFMQLESFVSHFKRAMGINSYLGIILDKKKPQAITSTKAINNLIGSRINNDMSIKVAMEPDDWETYKDVNGQFIEAIHDYGEVELDDSLKEYINGINK